MPLAKNKCFVSVSSHPHHSLVPPTEASPSSLICAIEIQHYDYGAVTQPPRKVCSRWMWLGERTVGSLQKSSVGQSDEVSSEMLERHLRSCD